MFWGDCFAIASNVPGSCFPTSFSRRSLIKKGLVGRSSLLSDRIYFLLSSLLLFCRLREVKIEVNGEN